MEGNSLPNQTSFDWNSHFPGSYRDDLPHWVVEHGRYSVTLRCAGTLPQSVVERMEEARRLGGSIGGAPTADTEESSRRAFLALEAFLDGGTGFAPFRESSPSQTLLEWLCAYRFEGLAFSDFVIMPNHLHLITEPLRCESVAEFRKIWANFKGRTSRRVNQHLNRSGPLWQRYWYDRWIRSETELQAWKRYLAKNPEKAGLCSEGSAYPFLVIADEA